METCRFRECNHTAVTRGLCHAHHGQDSRGEALHALNPLRGASDNDFFWGQVQKGEGENCWGWSGSTVAGYGVFRRHRAHRFSYELHKGPIPAGLQVDHQCRNRICVNPAHLITATNKVNSENLGVRRDNTVGERGVCFDKKNRKFIATATHHGVQYWGGRHNTAEEAADAARKLRMTLFTNNVNDRA